MKKKTLNSNETLTKHEADILCFLKSNGGSMQKSISEACDCSIGTVNKCIRTLQDNGCIDKDYFLTATGRALIADRSPCNAVILAAGAGMRMVPINLTTPKALLEVKGEKLIERLINQLHAVGITDITVVIGFMQEEFEYLIDEKGVDLVVNNDYFRKNNLSSLALVADKISNTYILPCDIWCRDNPFRTSELYSWYMLTDKKSDASAVRVKRNGDIVRVRPDEEGNRMVGISYIAAPDSEYLKDSIKNLSSLNRYDNAFWEDALYYKDSMIVSARVAKDSNIVEIDTYEQLRELDSNSNHLASDAIDTIVKQFNCKADDIVDISVLKKGMTNRSFLFAVAGEKYIMRIPGEGTDQLIDRKHEADVFNAIKGRGLCDDPVYINAENGYKITRYLEGIRVCDPDNENDLFKCMDRLREFHQMNLKVDHTFDVFGQILFYESLWEGKPSAYKDYIRTKERVFELKEYIETQDRQYCLTHIDAVNDNFLFYQKEDGTEGLQLTDWEYSGMQDPHVDLAMFCIYALYDKTQIDRLIDIYFEKKCDRSVRAKIYCYIAACGLLWSNWCEFKRHLGVEFGDYSLRQYRFAKDYYRYAQELIAEI